MPSAGLALKPKLPRPWTPSAGPFSRWVASSAKVVLQEMANAFSRLVVPRCSLSSLWNIRPPMFTWPGTAPCWTGAARLARADAVTTLKVEPGGKIALQRPVEPAWPLDHGEHLAGGRLDGHHVHRLLSWPSEHGLRRGDLERRSMLV